MKKNILILLFFFLFATISHAKIIDIEIAKNDALNLFNQNNKLKSLNNDILIEEVSFNEHLELIDSVPAFYIFNSSDNQFAIISADDRTPRVLGYCDINKFNPSDIPPQLKWLLSQYYKQIKSIPTSAKATLNITPRSTSNTILLKTANYNQRKPYNNLCPQNSLTGCVATAMAIIMKYHQWPKTGVGSHSYQYKNTVLSKNYDNTTFEWQSMLDSYDNESYNYYQANAIAELMYSCGVAVEMDYGPNESSANSHLTAIALLKHFKYDDNIEGVYASSFSEDQRIKMIRTEIENGRPILYSGSGNGAHAFVCDGISAWDVPHLNWGWGGSYNGYYLLNDFTPGENNDYSSNHYMVIGIQPEYETVNRSQLHLSSGNGFIPSTDSIVTNVPFECTITGLIDYDYTDFSGSIGLMHISETKGKLLLCSKKLSAVSITPFQLKDIIVTTEIDSTDIIQLVSLRDDETSWLPIVSSHLSKSYFKVRGDSFDTVPITWDIPAGVTIEVIDGPCLNYALKGSSYRFKLNIPEGSSNIQCFINNQRVYFNSNEYEYKISYTNKDSYHIQVTGNIGVEPTINSSCKITTLNNSIYINNLSANSNIKVYNINGQLIHSSISDGQYTIPLPSKGFYILKINDKSFKISNL